MYNQNNYIVDANNIIDEDWDYVLVGRGVDYNNVEMKDVVDYDNFKLQALDGNVLVFYKNNKIIQMSNFQVLIEGYKQNEIWINTSDKIIKVNYGHLNFITKIIDYDKSVIELTLFSN